MRTPAPVITQRRIGSDDDAYWWLVEAEGSRPMLVELPAEERRLVGLTDRDLHPLLPGALRRHVAAHGDADVGVPSPVQLYADDFRG